MRGCAGPQRLKARWLGRLKLARQPQGFLMNKSTSWIQSGSVSTQGKKKASFTKLLPTAPRSPLHCQVQLPIPSAVAADDLGGLGGGFPAAWGKFSLGCSAGSSVLSCGGHGAVRGSCNPAGNQIRFGLLWAQSRARCEGVLELARARGGFSCSPSPQGASKSL